MKYSDNYRVSHSIYCEEMIEKEKARKVAREQYARANRLERVLKVIRASRAHWRELYERVLGERDELKVRNDKLDAFLKADILDTRDKEVIELRAQNAELVTALKEIGEYDKVVPDSVPLGVLLIIDRALINYIEK